MVSYKENAKFEKIEILPKKLPNFMGLTRMFCMEGMVLLTENH